jgi:tetratricopeptide (TPR) repeat protein
MPAGQPPAEAATACPVCRLLRPSTATVDPFTDLRDQAPTPAPADVVATLDRVPQDTAIAGAPDPSEVPTPDRRPSVPGYEILGELGEGGMARVYRARNLRLGRVVALKMLLAGVHAPARTLARFRAEAEMVARLQHPNIVQIYEVGEVDGCPYLALELIEGGSLDRQVAEGPLPVGLAAELVETLARAIHHAHQRGIIHRDLKPANVLLQIADCRLQIDKPGSEPSDKSAILDLQSAIPKVADFGLAKNLDEAVGQTKAGTTMGTPSYMAPEQARGKSTEVGPAADIYSLGAILYELLTSRPPFQGDTVLETLEQVRSQEPIRPGRLRPRVPRDLETICLKCLEKEAGRRYASAELLAGDLRRYLAGEPIRARPVGPCERGVKWVKRRPALAALLGVTGLAAVTLLAASLWFNVRLQAAAERERDRAREAVRQRERAEANFQMALRAVEQMLVEVGEEQLAYEPRMEKKRRALLARALAFYQVFLQERATDPAVRTKAGQAYKQMADILRLLGQHEKALRAYRQSIVLLAALVEEFPNQPGYQQALADAYNWRGEIFRATDRFSEARRAYGHALDMQDKLAARYPRHLDYRRDKARTYYNLGLMLKDTNEPGPADQAFNQAIGILQDLRQRQPDNPTYRQGLARAYLNRGPVLSRAQGFAAALASYEEAVQVLGQLTREYPKAPDYRHELAVCTNNRGNLHFGEGLRWLGKTETQRALASFRRAESDCRTGRDLFRRLTADFPSVPVYKKELANTCNSLGAARYYARGPEGAASPWEEAQQLLAMLTGEFPKVAEYQAGLGQAYGNLGLLKHQQDQFPAARALYDKAVHHLRIALRSNPDNPSTRQALYNQYRNLAEIHVRLKDHGRGAETALALADVIPEQGEGAFFAACFLARCVKVVRAEMHLTATRRQTLIDGYSGRAVVFLRRALQKGYPVRFEAPELDGIRDRPDFQDVKLSGF